jgi:hypothetical protein
MVDPEKEHDRSGEGTGNGSNSRASIAALVVIVVLVIAGYFLTQKLKSVSALQDCVMSGRTNCAPVATPQN